MTAPELADVWVPIPLRWRHVRGWDLLVGQDGGIWAVTRTEWVGGQVRVSAMCGPDDYTADVDPDAAVNVLVPAPERDALTTTRDVLAARVIERRAG